MPRGVPRFKAKGKQVCWYCGGEHYGSRCQIAKRTCSECGVAGHSAALCPEREVRLRENRRSLLEAAIAFTEPDRRGILEPPAPPAERPSFNPWRRDDIAHLRGTG